MSIWSQRERAQLPPLWQPLRPPEGVPAGVIPPEDVRWWAGERIQAWVEEHLDATSAEHDAVWAQILAEAYATTDRTN